MEVVTGEPRPVRNTLLNPSQWVRIGALVVLVMLCSCHLASRRIAASPTNEHYPPLHAWRISPIIINETDPAADPSLWMTSADVSLPENSSAVLKLRFGPREGAILREPVAVAGAKVIAEFCDIWGGTLGRVSGNVRTPPVREGEVETKSIQLKNIPSDTQYLFIWLEWIDVSGKKSVFKWAADPHQLGLAVLGEMLRLCNYLIVHPGDDEGALIDRLLAEVGDVYRE